VNVIPTSGAVSMTPEERDQALQRITEIDAQLEANRSTVDADNIREWITLYQERAALTALLAEREAGS
jgi:hypothetical protein